MTPAVLRGASDEQHRITAPDLVRTLVLHFKGFPRIENLAPYTALRSLWLEGNGISHIEGLDTLVELQTLFLQQNTIERIGLGLRRLTKLVTLDLSDNGIGRVEGLDTLTSLQTLRLARNRLGPSPEASLAGVLGLPMLECLDLQDNVLEDRIPGARHWSSADPDGSRRSDADQSPLSDVGVAESCATAESSGYERTLLQMLRTIGSLRVLLLKGNPFVARTRFYRRRVVSSLPRLASLDRQPITELDRERADAWCAGLDTKAVDNADVRNSGTGSVGGKITTVDTSGGRSERTCTARMERRGLNLEAARAAEKIILDRHQAELRRAEKEQHDFMAEMFEKGRSAREKRRRERSPRAARPATAGSGAGDSTIAPAVPMPPQPPGTESTTQMIPSFSPFAADAAAFAVYDSEAAWSRVDKELAGAASTLPNAQRGNARLTKRHTAAGVDSGVFTDADALD